MAKFGWDERRLFYVSEAALENLSSTPSTDADSGQMLLYFKNDVLYFKKPSVAEVLLVTGAVNVGSGASVFKQQNAAGQLEFKKIVSSDGHLDIVENANDISLTVDFTDINDELDHGLLLGLADNDHPQYLLRDGTNNPTADISWAQYKLTNASEVQLFKTADQGYLRFMDGSGDLTSAVITSPSSSELHFNVDEGQAVVINGGNSKIFSFYSLHFPTNADIGASGGGENPGNIYSAGTVYGENIVANTSLTIDSLSGVLKASAGLVSGSATTDDLPEGANLYFTDERAQDAVGNILTDSASIDFTYNDAGDQISAVVIPGGVDHGGLAGLGDDDHAQYLLLAGRSGGQIANGGTAAGDDLELRSTAHATKGTVQIIDGSEFQHADEHHQQYTLQTTDNTTQTIATIPITDDRVYAFEVKFVSRRSDGGGQARSMFILRACVYRAAAGAATLQGSVQQDLKTASSGVDTNIAVSGNNAIIQVQGLSSQTHEWKAYVKYLVSN